MATTFNGQYVEALTKITVNQSTVIQSVSMYLQYNGSDGSQCLKFGVYEDNGGSPYGQSSPMNEPLIASTKNGYCFVVGNFGPGWETWVLQASDYLTIPAGVYWLAVLPEQSYGLIYHFTYTGLYPGQYLYNYGYFMYGFPVSYALGFPATVFGATPYGYGGYLILPYNSGNVGQYNAPYSLYVTGT
ncbi:MAG: hypothetical protein ACLP5V_13350 [Candidatus Bathyarchaeia archaeon]